MPVNREILSRLLAQLPQPVPRLRDLHIFLHWVSRQLRPICHGDFLPTANAGDMCYQSSYLGDLLGRPVTDIAEVFADSDDALRLAVIKACLNGSLPIPNDIFEANAVAHSRNDKTPPELLYRTLHPPGGDLARPRDTP